LLTRLHSRIIALFKLVEISRTTGKLPYQAIDLPFGVDSIFSRVYRIIMVNEEEPPTLMSGPPPAAFSSGGPPPSSAFASNKVPSNNVPLAGDLSSRWKQYEAEKTAMLDPNGEAHSNYDLYETPEKQRKVSSAMPAPRQLYDSNPPADLRRTNSMTKSGSYDTNALIAKYAGVSGVPASSTDLSKPTRKNSAITSSARAEAAKVLAMDDEINGNEQFEVQRTATGGFSASVADSEPSFFNRSSSSTRRTPAALSGLNLGKSKSSGGTTWNSGRYTFRDPKFRDDDEYHPEEEDNIRGPGVADPLEDENEARKKAAGYRDRGGVFDNVDFDGDFPRKQTSSWSSRYSDNPNVANATILDRYDKSNRQAQNQSSRHGARNIFSSAVSNVSNSVRAFFSKSSNSSVNDPTTRTVFGKGFSFKENRKGSPARRSGDTATGVTNLRTVWDDNFQDEGEISDQKQHKTWKQVALKKQRRRKILLWCLGIIALVVAIGVAISQTAWRWKYKNLWSNGNTHMDVTFYATSNTPFGYGSTEEQLMQDLANIPSDAEFVAHLGNLQDSSVGMCPASRMDEVASVMHGSPVPVYVVPGEHDWIRCPNQLTSLARWISAFGTYEAMEKSNSLVKESTTMATAGDFDRPHTTPSIFSKLHHGVLFFGLHLVSGTVTEGRGMEIQNIRDEKTVIFMRGTLDRLQGQYRSIVIFGNARPGPRQQNFFDSIREDLAQARVPVAYVHSHSGFGETEHYPFGSKKSGRNDILGGMLAIQAASGANNQPPLKITVGFGKKPFKVGEDL